VIFEPVVVENQRLGRKEPNMGPQNASRLSSKMKSPFCDL
jgi:hypothetical protein